jgi:hypothetical protein
MLPKKFGTFTLNSQPYQCEQVLEKRPAVCRQGNRVNVSALSAALSAPLGTHGMNPDDCAADQNFT